MYGKVDDCLSISTPEADIVVRISFRNFLGYELIGTDPNYVVALARDALK